MCFLGFIGFVNIIYHFKAALCGKSTTHPPTHPLPRSLCPHQNNKDYFDQSLDEIKLLRYVNGMDPDDSHGILRLYDFFYFKVRTGTRTPPANGIGSS